MSPEQAVLNQIDVDTRTDIYSLGIIMYELLVGQPPIDGRRLREQGLDEILRVIREQEPLRPSLRLSSQGKAANQTAAYRQTDTSTLVRALRGDLDWVVMKALEKDRSRRYESASELASDIERLLNDEPVEARPPSIAYKLRKFARRNRIAVTMGSLLLLAVVVGTSLTTSLWLDAKDRNALLRKTVQQYQDEVFDRLMERGLSGDRLEDVDTESMVSSMPADMMHALRAMSARNRGDFEQVVAHLEQAIELRPSDAYQAMLWHAKVMQGHQEDYDYNAVSFLLSKESLDPLENLFVGRALAFSDPTRGIERVKTAVERRNTVHAQSALAELHAHEAVTYDNPSLGAQGIGEGRALSIRSRRIILGS